MAMNGASPFSLRPWPIADQKPKNLSEFIARINHERGGFRNVTEAKLREEIKAKEEGRMDIDSPDGSSDSEDEAEAESDKSKTIVKAREEFLRNIESAHQSAMLGLDFVSLLLSKETPVQAGMTLSTPLREMVGIGTLGATKLKESNASPARIQGDLAVAAGWRIMGIDNMVDSVMAAAKRLEKEIELETKYWADVLSASDNGWTVCPLPHEPHTLGVRFGFAESALDFRNSSIAPMRRNDDGTVRLDVGKYGRGSQRVRITYRKNGEIIDQSPLPGRISDDAPLDDRVREARNTIFHQELWYELNREARTLLSSNVYYDDAGIIWKRNHGTEVIITLENLSEPDKSLENLRFGQTSCLSYSSYIELLLFQGHRQNHLKRTIISHTPPNRLTLNQPYTILRALIARSEFMHDTAVIGDFLGDLVRTLRRAGISTAACSSAMQNLSISQPQFRRNARFEHNFINQVVGNLKSLCRFALTPDTQIYIWSHASFVTLLGTVFSITLAPPNGPNGAQLSLGEGEYDPQENPLQELYPPADPNQNPYSSTKDVTYYIRQATTRALTQDLADAVAERLGRDDIGWGETTRGPSVADRHDSQAWISTSQVDGRLLLHLDAQWVPGVEGKKEFRRWTWRADGDDANGDSLENLVLNVMQQNI